MMPFEIEPNGNRLSAFDGVFPQGAADAMLFAVMDSLPEASSQAQIDSALVEAITGELRKPKTLQTVRRKLVRFMPILIGLAEREPEQFDAILLEYLDRQQTLAE